MKDIRNILAVGILGLAAAAAVLFIAVQNERRGYQQLKAQVQDISAMAQDHQLMQERTLRIENSAKGEKRGVASAINDLLANLGIQAKLQSVRNMDQKNFLDLSRQDAEVLINGLDMNEAVNLFYIVEGGSFPLSMRSLEMGRQFESPDVYDLRMVVSYFQKK